MSEDILHRLAEQIEQRKLADPKDSYVASLYHRGLDTILKKLGEEAIETVLAGKGGDDRQLICETADLWFHTLVMLAQRGLGPELVLQELRRRLGVSGLEEKAARGEFA